MTAPESYVVDGMPIPPPEPGPVEDRIDDLVLLIPYFSNGKAVNIYNDSDELLLSVDISQYASGIVQGKVTDYSGNPVANAFIQVAGTAQDSTKTNNKGDYQLIGLTPGNYTISVRPDPYNNLMMAFASIVATSGNIIRQDFSLNPAGSIAGGVIGEGGTPVPNVQIYLSGYETPRYSTDENGKYIIPHLGEGSKTVNIYAQGNEPWNIMVKGNYVKQGTYVPVDVSLGQTVLVDFYKNPIQIEMLILPIGGEVLPSGGTYGICWEAPNNAVKFDLKYSTDNGTSWNFIKTVTGLNCTHWEIPVVTVNKMQCRVKLIGYDSNGVPIGEDISDKP